VVEGSAEAHPHQLQNWKFIMESFSSFVSLFQHL